MSMSLQTELKLLSSFKDKESSGYHRDFLPRECLPIFLLSHDVAAFDSPSEERDI